MSSGFHEAKEALADSLTTLESKKATVQRCAGKLGTASDNGQLRETLKAAMGTAKDAMTQASQDLRRLKRQAAKGTEADVAQAQRMEQKVVQAISEFKRVSQDVTRQQQQQLEQHDDEDDAEEGDELLPQTFQRRVEEVDYNHHIVQQRQAEIEDIEQAMVEVGECFRAVQDLVNDGTEQLEQIDGNVDRAATNVEEGNRQLRRAQQHGQRSRRLKCWLLFFALVALGIIILWSTGQL